MLAMNFHCLIGLVQYSRKVMWVDCCKHALNRVHRHTWKSHLKLSDGHCGMTWPAHSGQHCYKLGVSCRNSSLSYHGCYCTKRRCSTNCTLNANALSAFQNHSFQYPQTQGGPWPQQGRVSGTHLNQHWAAVGHSNLACLSGGIVHCPCITTIHSDAGYAV